MKTKPLVIVAGEPYSIFSEIFLKIYKKYIKKFKIPIVLIVSENLFRKQMRKLNFLFNLKLINKNNILHTHLNNNSINIINVNFKFNKIFDKISIKSKDYINNCFKIALSILNKKKSIGLINGPISKKHFLNKKFPGITEYLSNKINLKNEGIMLIYNPKLSVSPITTHIPLKRVHKFITKKKIVDNVIKLNKFFKNTLKKKASIAILGLNPHCETSDNFSEEEKIIIPAIKLLKKKKIKVKGPFPADTFFFNKNINKYNLVVGMYHDQVLAPLKILYKFDAVNITIGLPFVRISPDHGTNNEMLGKNISDAKSLYSCLNFFKKIK
tara:strand:- start:1316 stop:2293 length:978 start_codon:yes stop_codon:yes gene_type:complete